MDYEVFFQRQLGELRRAAKQPQRRQPALTLVLGLEAERIARLELKLAFDGLRARARVARDQHVIDENPRTLTDREHEIRLRAICRKARLRLYGGRSISEIGIL